ncbi:hypothetical protein RM780_09715 [Streptomyces sp. DSM 44917]|uniref:Uncharacterized protein n=1 Tax=Streptomyces boetiae TaxID=3075541 RepID=A0ABU2L6Q3_9ACTN|nr:hypothetical protein [Streptomyces sp. DSM 44917]MDT0307239.1 hypothetical protein [Streptomyces sp. DSM 44917]
MAEIRNRSIWTKSEDPEWLARNAGFPDVLIMHGVTEQQAVYALERLRMLYGDEHLEIR